MRRLFLFLFIFSFSVLAKAQFGYYSNNSVLQALPSYKQAIEDYERLCQRCEKEIEHNERELTRQYVAFLDGYRDFPEPILRKRQNELQRLVDNSVKFRKELKVWLAEAKDSLLAPSYEMVATALEKVCIACDIDYIIDTDVAAYKYINPNRAVDVTRMLLDAALYPDKPVTELDGYDEYFKMLNPVAEQESSAPEATILTESAQETTTQHDASLGTCDEAVATAAEDVTDGVEVQE